MTMRRGNTAKSSQQSIRRYLPSTEPLERREMLAGDFGRLGGEWGGAGNGNVRQVESCPVDSADADASVQALGTMARRRGRTNGMQSSEGACCDVNIVRGTRYLRSAECHGTSGAHGRRAGV